MIEDEHGKPVHKEEQISQIIVSYFGKLFSSSATNYADTVNFALDPVITEEQNSLLIRLATASEIREAVFSIHADKAPGPDGFSAGFYHSNWDSVGESITKEVQQFFTLGSLPEKINGTHIRLIPKVKRP